MMLTIRPEQLNALAMTSNRALLIEHAHTYHPAAAAVLGRAGLDELVQSVIARCVRYRLENTGDYLRILDLTIVFGADWEIADLKWLDDGMRDTRIVDPVLRLRKLWRQALRRLAGEPQCP